MLTMDLVLINFECNQSVIEVFALNQKTFVSLMDLIYSFIERIDRIFRICKFEVSHLENLEGDE